VSGAVSLGTQARLWSLQRLSAMVLAICVVIHLVGIMWAVRGGLTGVEILARTRGSWGFAAFYATFVLACAVHVPVGLAAIAQEWWGWSARNALRGAWVVAAAIALLGLRAVYAVSVA
jgi:fumarate reductase subunit C